MYNTGKQTVHDVKNMFGGHHLLVLEAEPEFELENLNKFSDGLHTAGGIASRGASWGMQNAGKIHNAGSNLYHGVKDSVGLAKDGYNKVVKPAFKLEQLEEVPQVYLI